MRRNSLVRGLARYKDKVRHIDEKTEKRQKQQEEKEKQYEAATEEQFSV